MTLLIKGGANVNTARKGSGVSALQVAAEEGHHKCVRLLLGAGANSNATAGDGSTVLMHCAHRYHN